MARSSTSWQAGRSGNPAGRSKSEYALRDYARTFTKEALETIAGVMRDENAPPEARIRAADALLNRGWGKAPASLDVNAQIGVEVVSVADAIREASARRLARDCATDTLEIYPQKIATLSTG